MSAVTTKDIYIHVPVCCNTTHVPGSQLLYGKKKIFTSYDM